MSVQLSTTTPNLFVSQSQLSFDPTDVGDERFAVVRIGQEGSDVPVRVVSGVAPFFQVAVQANPLRFGTEATFTPAPGGTFVHVRYAPKQAGRHAGELLIEAGQATQLIGLSGRTTGLLARLSPQGRPAPLPAPRQKALPAPNPGYAPTAPDERSSPKPWLTLTLAVGLVGSGLTYWGVTHPHTVRQWLSAAPKESPRSVPAGEKATSAIQLANPPVATPPAAKETKAAKKQSRQADERQETIREATVPLAESPTPADRVAERNEPAQPEQTSARTEPIRTEPTQTETPPARIVRPVATRPVAERPTATESPKKKPALARPKPAETPTAESDLERELNKNQ